MSAPSNKGFLDRVQRWVFVVLGALVIAVAIVAIGNIGGWRAQILTRLFRVTNQPVVLPLSAAFQPKAPAGFVVDVFAAGFQNPRYLAVAPNGDVFVAESDAGQVIVLHPNRGMRSVESRQVFADQLTLPFGIVILKDVVYIAETNKVVRFRYDPTTSNRLSGPEHVLDLPGFGYNQHWTRSLALSRDGTRLYITVGSRSNESVESDSRRASILVFDLNRHDLRVYANGLRNAVGLAVNQESGDLWAAVNERDNLGDDVPSDYFTRVVDGGFYGWPFSYLGAHPDNRVPARPDRAARAIVPDVLLGAHVAPLQFLFYEAMQFPPAYRHGAFIAEHGSWNRRVRAGYQVVFVPFTSGMPSGVSQPFLSGFVPDPAGQNVYGRVVGVAVAQDGSLLVSDDGRKLIWRISYAPRD
jgi:glucose/arabinose dehydrogenase